MFIISISPRTCASWSPIPLSVFQNNVFRCAHLSFFPNEYSYVHTPQIKFSDCSVCFQCFSQCNCSRISQSFICSKRPYNLSILVVWFIWNTFYSKPVFSNSLTLFQCCHRFSSSICVEDPEIASMWNCLSFTWFRLLIYLQSHQHVIWKKHPMISKLMCSFQKTMDKPKKRNIIFVKSSDY